VIMADAALLARLEAVTARLEGFATGLNSRAPPSASGGGGGDAKVAAGGGVSEKVEAYNAYYGKFVVPFLDAARKFTETTRLAIIAERGFQGVRTFLDAAANCKKTTTAGIAFTRATHQHRHSGCGEEHRERSEICILPAFQSVFRRIGSINMAAEHSSETSRGARY